MQTAKRLTISELPYDQRPLYRIDRDPAACSNLELLAALIGGENQLELAEELMTIYGADPRELSRKLTASSINGIGDVTTGRIKAAVALGQRLNRLEMGHKPTVHCPEDAADLVMSEMQSLEQEEMWVMLLNTRNRILRIEKIYKGTQNSSHVHIGDLYRAAIRHGAVAVIVFHNHPSGDPAPSPDDIRITKEIVKAGELLDIKCLDHIIIGAGRFVSLERRGLLSDK